MSMAAGQTLSDGKALLGARKVLHVTQKLPGGTASYLEEVLNFQLRELGGDGVILAAAEHELDHLPGIPRSIVRPFGDSRRRPKALLAFARSVMATIRAERPAIVHLHSSFAGLLRVPIALLPSRYRPIVVYCAHGWSFNMVTTRKMKFVYTLIERLLAPLTDCTIAISAFEGRTAKTHGLGGKRLKVIENGVALEPPMHCEPPTTYVPNKINLLFIGRLDEQKGFDILGQAIERIGCGAIHLHVVGTRVLADEENAADETQVKRISNLTAYGWVPRDEVPGYIAMCDALVMPSRWEGFGLSAAEAMRQGKPVIASDAGALPDVIGDTGIVFKVGDVDALCAILSRITRPELAELGRKARERFAALFTSERMNREIIDCYAEALRAAAKGKGS